MGGHCKGGAAYYAGISTAVATCLAISVCFALPCSVGAHPGLESQIELVTNQIAHDPKNAQLYLKRGDLHRLHGEWGAAMDDYDRATTLDSNLDEVEFHRAAMMFEAGWLEPAKIVLDRFLAKHPDSAEALMVRARILVRLGQPLDAAENFSQAIAKLSDPQPEQYLERAQALVSAGSAHIEEAVQGLDEGIKRLGPIVTLQLYAIELELTQGRYDAALARLDQITPRSGRKEAWLARRGEILEQAGRLTQAHAAFAAALAELDSLPAYRRKTVTTQELETRLRAALVRYATTSGTTLAQHTGAQR